MKVARVPPLSWVYDYWLGDKDNFAADRAAAEQVIATMPDVLVSVRAAGIPQATRPRSRKIEISLGYSYQSQKFSDHAAELRKHPKVTPGSPYLLGAGHIKRFRRSSVVHGQDCDESRRRAD